MKKVFDEISIEMSPLNSQSGPHNCLQNQQQPKKLLLFSVSSLQSTLWEVMQKAHNTPHCIQCT